MKKNQRSPVKNKYTTYITGENKELGIYDIELDIDLFYSYKPGNEGTPAKRDQNGSILSYQDIGDPPEPEEIEVFDYDLDLNKLKEEITNKIEEILVASFRISFYIFDTYIFNVECDFDDININKYDVNDAILRDELIENELLDRI